MRKPALLLAATLLTACQSLRPGDLIFHVANTGNAITDVTPGMIDHVVIYAGQDTVIEAIPQRGVTTTSLTDMFSREDGYYLKGHVKGADRRLSVDCSRRYIGLPYDSLYLEGNNAIYCSELVVESYVDRHGRRLLDQVPMTFRDTTGHIGSYWQQLYARHYMEVPEGAPGSNPSELSQRHGVTIKKLK